MNKMRVFIIFDGALRDVQQELVATAERLKCPFRFLDRTIQKTVPQGLAAGVRHLIAASDFVLVLCGDLTDQARSVEHELRIARELDKPYALIQATGQHDATRPMSVRPDEPMYPATWETVAAILRGEKPLTV